MYEVISASVIGARHIAENIPREDSCGSFRDEGIIVFAAADGHGDSNCPRSAQGSEAACGIAIDALRKFGESYTSGDKLLHSELELERVTRQLAANIVTNWKQTVTRYFYENPLTEEERACCGEYQLKRYDCGQDITHIYGTTLIAGVLTEKYLLILQQGDGMCIVVHKNGQIDMPVPEDEYCVGNVTTSLCEDDAIERCRSCVTDTENDRPIA